MRPIHLASFTGTAANPMTAVNPFARRASYYARYRPTYPTAVIDKLREMGALTEASIVADIGAGTGISTELFLKHGYQVWAVEPCREMRLEAEAQLSSYAGYKSREGTAERLPLADSSIDLVISGQAFHWFQPRPTRQEFVRVLRPPGFVALFWNRYLKTATPAMHAYSKLVSKYFGPPRLETQVNLEAFYQRTFYSFEFVNDRQEDFETVHGGLLSHSRAPLPGDPAYASMRLDLQRWFQRYADSGQVCFPCRTELHIGSLLSDLELPGETKD